MVRGLILFPRALLLSEFAPAGTSQPIVVADLIDSGSLPQPQGARRCPPDLRSARHAHISAGELSPEASSLACSAWRQSSYCLGFTIYSAAATVAWSRAQVSVNKLAEPLAGAQELVHILSWAYGVVPATEVFVGDEVELTHFRVRDLGSGGVGLRDEISADGKSGCGFGGSDEFENLVDIGERFAYPVLADLAEQTMFDGIPLGSARGIVADRNGEAERSAECILNRFPPGAASRTVTSSAIRQDEQFAGGRVWGLGSNGTVNRLKAASYQVRSSEPSSWASDSEKQLRRSASKAMCWSKSSIVLSSSSSV